MVGCEAEIAREDLYQGRGTGEGVREETVKRRKRIGRDETSRRWLRFDPPDRIFSFLLFSSLLSSPLRGEVEWGIGVPLPAFALLLLRLSFRFLSKKEFIFF